MDPRRTAEGSVVFIHNKLKLFCSPANDFTPAEEKVISCIRSTLTNLREIVKQLDAIKTNDSGCKTRKQKLHDELSQLSFKISHRFDRHTPVPVSQTSQFFITGFFDPIRCRSLEETLSQLRYISNKYGRLLEALKKEGKFNQKKKEEEGSSAVGDSVLIQGGDLVVFKCHKAQLIQLLLKDDSGTKNVLVTGRRGSGKTTLVRNVCEDVQLRKHFGTIAWISVPPIDDPDLIRHEIYLQLLFENKAPVPDHLSASDVNDEMLEPQIVSLLQKERCLIVVDNLVDQSTFETFQNVSHETGQVIFIARRVQGPWCSGTQQDGHQLKTYEIKDLSEEESWALFRLKTFPKRDVPYPFKGFRKKIVSMCWKLPEAINLFSHLLRNKKKRDDEWELMIPWFERFPFRELRLIQRVLKIIYRDDGLGSCLLYLSIFPEISPISRMRISRLWTAEGFLNLEKAEDFLQELLKKRWIHPVETRSDGRLSTFRVDSLVREIIVSLTDRLNLLRVTGEGCTNWPERVRYLSAQGGIVKDLNERLSQLRSLFMFNVSSNKDKITMSEASPSETSGNQWFQCNVKVLQVLDLTGETPEIARDAALSKSTLLGYFRDTSIKVIPLYFKKFQNLGFLVLKHSSVTELPEYFGELKRTRHILIYHHEKDPLMESYNLIGFKALCRMEGLERLEKLCFVEADDSILKDLGTLTKLTRLGLTKLRKKDGKTLCTSLEELKLMSLNLHAFDEDEILDLHHLSSPPKSLKRLYLHGRLERLPNWISSLHHLTKMVLRWSNLEEATQQEEDLLTTLGKLPELVELELRRAYNGRQLDFKSGQFPKLKILLLDELGRLRTLVLDEGTMPCLEDLTISRCQWLESIPTGIEHISTLQALEFFDMSPEFYKMIPDDYRNSEGKPKVYLTQWRPGQWKTIPWGTDECDECFAGEH